MAPVVDMAVEKLRRAIDNTGPALSVPIWLALQDFIAARDKETARHRSEMAALVGAATSVTEAQLAVSTYVRSGRKQTLQPSVGTKSPT